MRPISVLLASMMLVGIFTVPAGAQDGDLCGDTSLEQPPCEDTVPDVTGDVLVGDIYEFQADAGTEVVIRVDTTDRGDGRSNLDPIAFLVSPSGALIGAGDDEVACTFPPICGFACPEFAVTLPEEGTYTLIIRDFGDAGEPRCTGGGYSATADGSGGLTLTVDDGDVPFSARVILRRSK